jgi:hypothetical protein
MTAFCSHNSYGGNNTIDRLFNDATWGLPFSFDDMGNVFIHALLATFFFFMLVSCSSALKMEGTCSSETSVDFQRNTRRHIPEDKTLHIHLMATLTLLH